MSIRLKHIFTNEYGPGWCIYCGKYMGDLIGESKMFNMFTEFMNSDLSYTKESKDKWVNDNCLPCITEDEFIIKQIIE